MIAPKLTNKEFAAIREIRNSLIHRGRNPSVRELMEALKYRSPRSAAVLIEQLTTKKFLRKKEDGSFQLIRHTEDDAAHAHTVDVPLVGAAACGMPILAEENIEATIPVSTKLARPNHRYFLLKAKGDSMNAQGINDGDLVLVRQQTTAENGDIVVALIDDKATIKEFCRTGETIILKPKSKSKEYKPIVLTKDFQIQGVVVTSIPKM